MIASDNLLQILYKIWYNIFEGSCAQMEATTFSDLRKNLKAYMDKTTDDDEAVIVTRKDNKNVVLISLDNYNNMLENMHVLGNKTNRDWLEESLKQYKAGQAEERKLMDE